MKRPTWATLTGVLGILFGLYGSYTNASIFMVMLRTRDQFQQPFTTLQKTMSDPAVMKQMQESAQKLQQVLAAQAQQKGLTTTNPILNVPPTIAANPSSSFPQIGNTSAGTVPSSTIPDLSNAFAKVFKTPPAWLSTWQTGSSAISACLWLLLLIASVGLLQLQPWGIPMFYGASGGGIAFALVKSGVLISTMGVMGFPMSFGVVPGLVVNLIMLFVVVTGDKSAFGLSPATGQANPNQTSTLGTSGTTNPVTDINPFKNYSDLRKIGIWALGAASVSWFLFGTWLSIIAVIYGAYGLYLSVSQKERWSTILLNFLAIIVGSAAKLSLMKALSGDFVAGHGQGTIQYTPLACMFAAWLIILLAFVWAWKNSPDYQDEDLAIEPGGQLNPAFSDGTKQAFVFVKVVLYIWVIATGWYSLSWMRNLRYALYAGHDTVTLLVPSYASLAMFLPITILFLILWQLIRKLFAQRFPLYDQYHVLKVYVANRTVGLSKDKQREFWDAALQRINLSKLARGAWRGIFSYNTVSWIIFGITLIPLMDCYVKVNANSLSINPLFGFQEMVIPWEGLSAHLGMTSDRLKGMRPQLEITSPDGTKVDLWACLGQGRDNDEDMLKVMPVLLAHHVNMEVTPPAWDQIYGGSPERTKLEKEVFELAEKAAVPIPSTSPTLTSSFPFDVKLLKTFHSSKGTTLIWLASYTADGITAKWRIELKLNNSKLNQQSARSEGAFYRESGSNDTFLLQRIAQAFQEKLPPLTTISRVQKYPFGAIVSREGDQIKAQLYLSKVSAGPMFSEVLMNLDLKGGHGQFVLQKNPMANYDPGEYVLQEFAKVL